MNSKKILAIILIVGLIVRLVGINAPIVEVHTARQILDAMVAKNFYKNGFNIFYPQLDFLADNGKPVYYALELHLVPWIVSFFYALFGINEMFGRIVSILFFCASTILLFLFAKKFFGEKIALLSAAFFTFSPLNILISRSFQPESAMLFFAISSIYLFSEWLDFGKKKFFILSALCAGMAILLKAPVVVYLVFPFIFLSFNSFGKKMFFKKSLWLFAAIVLLPFVLWNIWANQLYIENPHFWTTVFSNAALLSVDKASNISLFDQNFYTAIFSRLIGEFMTPIGFLFFAIGLIFCREKKSGVFKAWLFGIAIFLLAFPGANYFHNYYQLGIIPPMAVFASVGIIEFFKSGFFARIPSKKLFAIAGILLFAIFVLYFARAAYKPMIDSKTIQSNEKIFLTGNLLNSLAETNSKIVVNEDNLVLLYYGNRTGWTMGSATGKSAIEKIENFKRAGADYFSSTDIKKFYEDKEFSEYLKKNYSVVSEDGNFILFKLN